MGKQTFQNDSELLAAIQGDERARTQALNYFFENPKLMHWTVQHVRLAGGSLQDAQDVFEESFIVFERQVRTGYFRGESSLTTFFHGIVRWQWLAFRRKNRPTETLENVPESPDTTPTPEKLFISEEKRVILSRYISQVGERCSKLLGWYQLNYSMREISTKLGYSSDQVAANEVHSCREKLKKLILGNPEITAMFK